MVNPTLECWSPLRFSGQPTPKLYDRVVETLQARHYSHRTNEPYVRWIRRFSSFHAGAQSRKLGEGHGNKCPTNLAVMENVAAATDRHAGLPDVLALKLIEVR